MQAKVSERLADIEYNRRMLGQIKKEPKREIIDPR